MCCALHVPTCAGGERCFFFFSTMGTYPRTRRLVPTTGLSPRYRWFHMFTASATRCLIHIGTIRQAFYRDLSYDVVYQVCPMVILHDDRSCERESGDPFWCNKLWLELQHMTVVEITHTRGLCFLLLPNRASCGAEALRIGAG